jgi:predicted DNA binding protein
MSPGRTVGMRYATAQLIPEQRDRFHPIGEALDDADEVRRGPIYRLDLLDDGTGAMLSQVHGDRDSYCAILDSAEHVLDYAVSGSEGTLFGYLHFEPTDLAERMLLRRRESEVMFDMPIDIADDGSYVVTLIGEDAAFTEAFHSLPDEIGIEVVEAGEYHADTRELFDCLTDRQQEVLETAVREGYYESPREATQDDVAAALRCSPGTVGEHLRKIESRVFSQFVVDGA